MHQSFRIRNFRCFRDVAIEPLGLLNLIAGRNNVGKTSLLEALFLHSGWHNPTLPTYVNAVRGLERVEFTADSVWGWLFFEKRALDPIELTATRKDGSFERVTVQLGDPPQSLLVEGVQEEGDCRSRMSCLLPNRLLGVWCSSTRTQEGGRIVHGPG